MPHAGTTAAVLVAVGLADNRDARRFARQPSRPAHPHLTDLGDIKPAVRSQPESMSAR